MANYIGYCITPRISSDHFAKVLVPAGGLVAGQVVNCISLASTVAGVSTNYEVYTATRPTTATLDSNNYALIVNGGFETMTDGRRPAGQPDYTQYTYEEADVADAIFLDRHLVYEIGVASISGASVTPTSDIGKYIVPADGTYTMALSSTATAGGCVKILGVRNFANGGNYGGNFVTTYICVAL